MLDRVRYRFDERTVLVIGFLLILIPVGIYWSGIQITERMIPSRDLLKQSPIGEINRRKNTVRKRAEANPVFSHLITGDALYVGDRILTGKDSTARITLSDGNLLELGPESLIRIEPVRTFGLGGIKRKIKVTLETGSVRAASREQSVPMIIENPAGEVILEVPPPSPASSLQQAPSPVTPEFKSASIPPLEAPRVLQEMIKKEEEKAVLEPIPKSLKMESPTSSDLPILSKLTLAIRPPADEIRMISYPKDRILSGDIPLSSQVFQFNWKPVGYGLDGNYRVTLEMGGSKQNLEVSTETLEIPVPEAPSGKFDLVLEARLKNGEVICSKPLHHEWALPTPRTVSPKDGAIATEIQMENDSKKILLTWREMNACSAFRVEVAKDDDTSFSRPEIVAHPVENFITFNLPDGMWRWRVSCAYTKTLFVPGLASRFRIEKVSSP